MSNIKVIKIGGNVVDNPEALERFVVDFANTPGHKILVHGGGVEATRLSARLNIETRMIEGRRVTDADTLEVVTMVYAGLINKRIVAKLQNAGCNAIGLTGADAHIVTATRRKPNPIDYGFVGDIHDGAVDGQTLVHLCKSGIVPVVCAIMYDGEGGLLNCNADSVATAVSLGVSKLATTDLVFCFDKKGVLRDVDDPTSTIPTITPANYPDLRSGNIIFKGMIPKIDNALRAIAEGLRSVRICHSDDLNNDCGTTIHNI